MPHGGEKEHKRLKKLIGNILWINVLKLLYILHFQFSNPIIRKGGREQEYGKLEENKTEMIKILRSKGLNVLLLYYPFHCPKAYVRNGVIGAFS